MHVPYISPLIYMCHMHVHLHVHVHVHVACACCLYIRGSKARAALTPVRALLLRGSAVQNVIGATFLPVVLTLAARGPEWWRAVHEVCPG